LADRGVRPDAGFIVPGSHLSFGIKAEAPEIGGSAYGIEAGAMWSFRGYQLYSAQAGRVAGRHDMFELRRADANVADLFGDQRARTPGLAVYADVRHHDYPRVEFFGLGAGDEDMRTDYGVSATSVDGVVQWQRSDHVGFSARAGVIDLDVGPGSNDGLPDVAERFDAVELPGLLQRPRYVTVGASAAIDRRDKPGAPTAGSFVAAALWRFNAISGGARGFTRAAADARVYRAVAGERHVVAGRLLASTDWTGDRGDTPFYLQSSLGGARTLRGYRDYRFRGEAFFHLSGEYRWHAWKFLEVAPFVDAGIVAGRLQDLPDANWHWSPGIGLRVRSDSRVFFRMDWAAGADGQRVVFAMSAPF
jgi:outer membrane protein assembly factor BamA